MLHALIAAIVLLFSFLFPASDALLTSAHSHSIIQLYSIEKGSGGTGYEIEYQGREFIITNAHVCELKGEQGTLIAESPYMPKQSVKVLAELSNTSDLCIVEPLKGQLVPLHLADKELHLFETFYTTGYAYLGPLVTVFGMSRQEMIVEIEGEKRLAVLAQAHIVGGDSGSPVFNSRGEVVGTIFAGDRDQLGLYIPLSTLKEFLNSYFTSDAHQ